MNRRWSVLSALLATALLLYCMPGLLIRQMGNTGRTDDRLKTAPSRTMVVWVTSWMEEDRKLLTSLCSAFEKQRPGLRLFLRRVDAEELYTPQAVLPDVVLHTTGDILSPEDALLPLAQMDPAAASGMHGGQQYGIALWYNPLVFSVPDGWFENRNGEIQPETSGKAYFTLATPAPEKQVSPMGFEDIPWRRMLETGSVVSEYGPGLPCLLLHCPGTVRQELARLEVTIRKPESGEAAVCSLATHGARGTGYRCIAISPPVGARARYVSLCKDGEDAKAFLAFLQGEEAQAAAAGAQLVSVADDSKTNPLWTGEESSGNGPFLPNAFLMNEQSMDQLCIQDFRRGEDPVATLLRLR